MPRNRSLKSTLIAIEVRYVRIPGWRSQVTDDTAALTLAICNRIGALAGCKNFGFEKGLCHKCDMTNKIKDPSPLVQAVLKLDSYLSEIVRLGNKIESMDLKSDFDYEQAQKLMNRFAECGTGVSEEVMNLSATLTAARTQAEAAAQVVAAKAEQLEARQNVHQEKMDNFRTLGEKVRDLTLSLNDLKRPEGENLTEQDQAEVAARLSDFQMKLKPLIEEARTLRTDAQGSKLKTLEQGADSLVQSLSAIGRKLETFAQTELH